MDKTVDTGGYDFAHIHNGILISLLPERIELISVLIRRKV